MWWKWPTGTLSQWEIRSVFVMLYRHHLTLPIQMGDNASTHSIRLFLKYIPNAYQNVTWVYLSGSSMTEVTKARLFTQQTRTSSSLSSDNSCCRILSTSELRIPAYQIKCYLKCVRNQQQHSCTKKQHFHTIACFKMLPVGKIHFKIAIRLSIK